ncbi:MAG: hypothetical protein EBZ47_03200 [Chlamydiae bacterium]|nr:hypothetical protein [Chlamydiota bacterium]
MSVPPPSSLPSGSSAGSSNTADANNAQMQNDVNQWYADSQKISIDESAFYAALAQMNELAAEGKTDLALMYLFTSVFPAMLSFQEDTITLLADSQNISSDLRNFVSCAENDFNAGGSASPEQMADMYNNVQSLNSWASYLSSDNPGYWSAGSGAPLSATDAANIEDDCNTIAGVFGTTDWGNPANMSNDVKSWFSEPTSSDNAIPSQNIKTVQGAFQQANSAVSSISTTLQSQEQFYIDQYNQYVGIDNSMQQSECTQNAAFVNNQKVS